MGENEADVAILVDAASKEIEAGAASYLEIRGWHKEFDPVQLNLAVRGQYIQHFIDLESGIDAVEKNLNRSIRQGIQQAKHRDVSVRMTHAQSDLDCFYELNVATRKKLGVLPQPYSFFKALFNHMLSQKLGFMMFTEYNHKPIAGGVFLVYKDTIYYKFNASDEHHLQKRPNNLVLWEALCYACANGFKKLDFGRCSEEQTGLRNFKSRWGAKEVNLPYFYYPAIKGFASNTWSNFGEKVMKSFSYVMPSFAFKIAGSLLYKHIV